MLVGHLGPSLAAPVAGSECGIAILLICYLVPEGEYLSITYHRISKEVARLQFVIHGRKYMGSMVAMT